MIDVILEIINMLFIMAFGYFLKKIHFFKMQTMADLNKFVFNVLFPASIGISILKSDITSIMDVRYISYVVFLMFFVFIICALLGKVFSQNKGEETVMTQAMYRGNFIVMGFPMLTAVLGNEYLALGSLVLFISQFFYNIASVSLFERLSSDTEGILSLIKKILKAPLIISIFVGLILNILNVHIGVLEAPISKIGSIASTIALLTIGHNLNFEMDVSRFKKVFFVTFTKLVIGATIAIIVGHLFDISYEQMVCSVILFGAPCAVNTYIFAQNYGVEAELAQYFVIMTTICYMFTLPIMLSFVM